MKKQKPSFKKRYLTAPDCVQQTLNSSTMNSVNKMLPRISAVENTIIQVKEIQHQSASGQLLCVLWASVLSLVVILILSEMIINLP